MDSMLLALDRITVWSYLQLHLHFDTRFAPMFDLRTYGRRRRRVDCISLGLPVRAHLFTNVAGDFALVI